MYPKSLLILLALLFSSSNEGIAQQSETGRGSVTASSMGETQNAAMQLLSSVNVLGVSLGMPVGEAIAVLEAQAYDLNPNPQLVHGTTRATFYFVKGKVASSGEDRERLLVEVLMDKLYDPRRPYIFNSDWPVVSLKYDLQDQENTANFGQFTYDWSNTPAHAMQAAAYATLCPAATGADYACRLFEDPSGFTFNRIADGKPVRVRALFSGAANGRYQIILRHERADEPAPSRQSSRSRSR